MEDTEIICAACRQPFVFTAAEQAYYAERGFQLPKRCRACRQARRKSSRHASTSAILPVARREVDARQTFKEACAKCEAEVVLVYPARDRQVYCCACFTERANALG